MLRVTGQGRLSWCYKETRPTGEERRVGRVQAPRRRAAVSGATPSLPANGDVMVSARSGFLKPPRCAAPDRQEPQRRARPRWMRLRTTAGMIIAHGVRCAAPSVPGKEHDAALAVQSRLNAGTASISVSRIFRTCCIKNHARVWRSGRGTPPVRRGGRSFLSGRRVRVWAAHRRRPLTGVGVSFLRLCMQTVHRRCSNCHFTSADRTFASPPTTTCNEHSRR